MAITRIDPLPALRRTGPNFKSDVDKYFGEQVPVFTEQAGAFAEDLEELAQDLTEKSDSANRSAQAAASSQESAAASAEAAQSWANVAVAGSAGLTGSSTSTQAIGTGLRTFTVPAGKDWTPGLGLRAWAAPGAYVAGPVVSYSGTTLVMDVDVTRGQGSYSSWQLGVHFPEPDVAALVFAITLS